MSQNLGKCKLRVPELDFVVLKGGKTESGDYTLDNPDEVKKFFETALRQWVWEPYQGVVFFGRQVSRKANIWDKTAKVGEVIVFNPFATWPFTVIPEETFKATYQRVVTVI